MKSLRILFAVSAFCLLAFSTAFAQSQEKKATEILKASKTTFDALKDFSANVTYTLTTPGAAKATAKTGKVKFKKGKFHIVMEDQEMFCDKAKVWVYLKKDKECNVSAYDEAEGLDVESIFNLYQNSSKARFAGQEVVNGVTCNKILMANTNQKLGYNQIKVWINAKTNFVEKAVLTDRRQNSTTYEFTGVKTNNGFLDTEFQFNAAKFPGVKVYDESN